MQNLFRRPAWLFIFLSKLLHVMRLAIAITFLFTTISLASEGQTTIYNKTIDFHAQNITLKQAFSIIEQKTDFLIGYNADALDDEQRVNVQAKDTPVAEILKKLLKGYKGEISQIGDFNIQLKVARTEPAFTGISVKQDVRITGKVLSNTGIFLTSVTVKNTRSQMSVLSNSQGLFSIAAKPGDTLQFQYLGYLGKNIAVNDNKELTVYLTAKANDLDEVVVIGYGAVRKRDLTGAVSVVNTEDLRNIPVTRVDQMLQGRIAGAEIMSTSGEPGAGTSIRIRGTRSISATNEPLYVVDGVMDAISDLNELNPSDVASIQVLKDASSTAIYGSRGSNGVILVTTKGGRTDGKTNFTFRSDIGTSKLPRFLDLMNATEFAQLQNDRFYFASTANQSKPIEEYPFPDPSALGEGTNWTKEITRSAPYQNHTLSAAGGDKSTQYYFSFNVNDNQGIIINSGLRRYQARLNLDKTFNKYVKSGIRFNYSYIDHAINKADIGTSTLWYKSTIFLAPTIPAYKEDGSFNDWNSQWYSGTLFDSPLANSKLQRRDQLKKGLSSMFYVEVKPINNIKIRSSVSFYDYNRFDDNFYPSTLPTRASKNTGAYAYKRAYRTQNILNENTINYTKTWNDHHVDVLYGFTYQTFRYVDMSVNADGYFIDEVNTNDLAAVPSKETVNIASNLEDQTRLANLARINYNYKSRYYLTISGRADGGSNFADNHKWGFFPSAAFKWNLKEEKFLKGFKAINQLALRLSAGVSGNDAIARYQSLAMMNSISNGYIFNGATPVAYLPSRIANEGLTWEKTATYNAGLDVTVLNNRLDFTIEAYQSKTSDLLLTVQLPSHTGYTSRLSNIGKTSNRGVELTVNSRNIERKSFSWSSSFTLAHNKQLVDDIGGLDRVSAYDNPYGAQYMMYGYVKGQPLNALWGMQYGGVWKSTDEIEQNKSDKRYASSAVSYYSPGRQRYIDQNQDGILDNNDLVYLGNADPVLYGGIQNSFNIKGFNVSFYLNYSLGGKIYNPVELFMGTGTYLSNQFEYMTNAWHPVRNPTSDYPRADSKDDIPNDRFVHSATFLRLKNASVSYTFNLQKIIRALNTLTLTASGNNLYLWKDYNGYDPEISTQSGGSTIRRMDNGAYPNSRTIVFSAELKF
ncbi:SusC/RagA family TonB-linked outer membrane protein [Olivibacter domesticus]|uniref:TonB-linked outer membrane protein, SusC/RagA family n=1 Tax=Olivibacter domesticus TaxID=407022 RepID=A0A1H7UV41_OLID1|nr:TonB-dependent receptor [Olivibacter domesticus]SEM00508.1 TonB-linked outer membrane protein, SusC/RagA family [Olivibacter domesticus]